MLQHFELWLTMRWLKLVCSSRRFHISLFVSLLNARVSLIRVHESSKAEQNKVSSPPTLCLYSQIFVYCSWNAVVFFSFYFIFCWRGNGIFIVTDVCGFSNCKRNNWIILEVILLFKKLTRTVQTVSGEAVCLEQLWAQGFLFILFFFLLSPVWKCS